MMPRNLDRRVEVLVPIENARARQELQGVLQSVFSDDVHAWRLGSDGTWTRFEPAKAGKPVDHQAAMMRRAQARARRQTDGRYAQVVRRPCPAVAPPTIGRDARRGDRCRLQHGPAARRRPSRSDGAVIALAEERSYLRLGAEIERTGTLGDGTIDEAPRTSAAAFARRAADSAPTARP